MKPILTASISGLKITLNRPSRTDRQGQVTHWREETVSLTVTEAEQLLLELPAALAEIQQKQQEKRQYDIQTRQQELDRLREQAYGSNP